MENIHFGQKLKDVMDKSGLSRKEIAVKTGESEANLYKLVKHDDVKVKTLMRFAKTLDLPLQYFFEVEDSQIVEEVKQLLVHERTKSKLLEEQLRFFDQQFGILIGILKDIEKGIEGKAEGLKLITPLGPDPIPLSRFINIFHKMITSANKLPEKEEMYVKYTGLFLNITEVRQAILENIHLYPVQIQEIFSDLATDKAENEYIDFERVYKNIGK